MAPVDSAQHQRFEEALPFYLNGTLPADEREFIEQYLRQHPNAHAEAVVWGELSASLAQSAADIPADIGLARLEQRMRAAPNQQRKSLSASIVDWLRPLVTPKAFVLTGVLMLLQTGAIVALLMRAPEMDAEQSEVARTRSLGKPVSHNAIVVVKFTAGSSIKDVTQVLAKLGATVVAGPNQDERYELKVRRDSVSTAIDTLKRSGTVLDIQVLPDPTSRQ